MHEEQQVALMPDSSMLPEPTPDVSLKRRKRRMPLRWALRRTETTVPSITTKLKPIRLPDLWAEVSMPLHRYSSSNKFSLSE